MQSEDDVALTIAENLPAGQPVHEVAPLPEYVPAAQLWHVEDDVAPTVVEDVPAGQLWHVEADPAPTVVE